MDENRKSGELLTVRQLTIQQIHISIITAVIDIVLSIAVFLYGLKISVSLGIIIGGAVGIAFHWWMYHDLKKAIERDSLAGARYAGLHAIMRNAVFVAVLFILILNGKVEISIAGLIAGVLSVKPVVYIYNMVNAGKAETRNQNEH